MIFFRLLNDYSTKAMTDENQGPIFRILLLPRFRLVILNLYRGGRGGGSSHLYTLIVQSREHLNAA